MATEISLKGCIPPIPTPFDSRGRVDHEQLAQNLERWQKAPLIGFAVLGSNGEAVLLKAEEKRKVWETAGKAIDGDHLFIAGTGCESTPETLELSEEAARLGARAVLIVTPHYYRSKMDHHSLVNHYSQIADRSPVPVILYNMPASTGIDLSAETILELAGHPNIIGLKESSGNVVKMGQVVAGAEDNFQVLAGSGSFLLPALSIGARGGIMALASVAPHQLAGIVSSFDQGSLDKAREMQLRLISANAAVTTKFGIPGLKAALDCIGMYGGPVRGPLADLNEQQRKEVRAIMIKAGILKN